MLLSARYFDDMVFSGTDLDRVLTAVIYKLNRKLGLIDKALRSAGVDVENLDPFSRWFLRCICITLLLLVK